MQLYLGTGPCGRWVAAFCFGILLEAFNLLRATVLTFCLLLTLTENLFILLTLSVSDYYLSRLEEMMPIQMSLFRTRLHSVNLL